jgi:hypothetical protein
MEPSTEDWFYAALQGFPGAPHRQTDGPATAKYRLRMSRARPTLDAVGNAMMIRLRTA